MNFFSSNGRLLSDGSLLSRLFNRGNNRYISQPNFNQRYLNFDKNEEWVSVEGHEMELYNTTAELRIVIDRLGLMFSNGIWKERDKNGELVENSEAVKLLNNPNIFQSNKEFLFQAWIQRCLYANVFEYNLKGSSFQDIPSALWNLSPSRIIVNRTGLIWQQTDIEKIITNYTFRMDGRADETFKTNDIIQYSIPNSDDPIIGESPLVALKMDLSNLRAAKGYSNVILTKKGAIGMWSADGKDAIGNISLTPEEEKQISKQLTDTYGLFDNQASVFVSSKPLKWSPATYPTKDLLLFESINAGKKAIIDIYGANDNMFSRGSDGKGDTFTNVSEGDKLCYQNTIIPFANDYANGKAKRWGLLDKGHTLELCYNHLPALSDNEVAEYTAKKLKAEGYSILVSGQGENGGLMDDTAAREFLDID